MPSLPGTVHAACEDYRAAASIDLSHDAKGEKVGCPVLVLWGARGIVGRLFDPIADWRAVAGDVRGRALPAGHYLPEEVPDETLRELTTFFAS